MFRIDTPTAVALKPARTPIGTPGHFTEAGTPTRLSAEWFEAVQEEMTALVENAGLTLDKSDDAQLWSAIGGGAAAVCHATDTGVVTTNRTRAVIASYLSRASDADSVVVASSNSVASGVQSMVCASYGSTASYTNSAVLGSIGSVAASSGAMVLGSLYCRVQSYNYGMLLASRGGRLIDQYTLAGAYDAGASAEPGFGISNVGLTWRIHTPDGEGFFTDLAAGDVNGGTRRFTVDGASGDVHTDGDLDVDGGLDVASGSVRVVQASGTVEADGGFVLPDGADEVSETYTESWVTVADGTLVESTRANGSIAADSMVLWSWDFGTGTEHVTPGRAIVNPAGGSVKFQLRNTSGGALSGTWTIRYVVVNPA